MFNYSLKYHFLPPSYFITTSYKCYTASASHDTTYNCVVSKQKSPTVSLAIRTL